MSLHRVGNTKIIFFIADILQTNDPYFIARKPGDGGGKVAALEPWVQCHLH